jgi:hypothetical protein
MERLTVNAKELIPGDRVFSDPPPKDALDLDIKQLRTDLVTRVGLDLCDGTVDIHIVRDRLTGVVSDLPMDLELEIMRDQ